MAEEWRKVMFYIHGMTTGEELARQLEARDDVQSAKPVDIVDNPDPRLPERNEAVLIVYDSKAVTPNLLQTFVESLGYKVVAQEEGPVTDRL
jgi:hypothetical protein